LIYLILSIPLIFAFSHLFKYAQIKKCAPIPVITLNYSVVFLILLLYHLYAGFPKVTASMLYLGTFTGCVFMCALYVYTKGLEKVSVNLCMMSFRLSIVIPIGFAVLFWDEPMNDQKIIGIIFALLAIVFMSSSNLKTSDIAKKTLLLVISLIFVLQGMAQVMTEAIHYMKYDEVRLFILMNITGVAFLSGTGILVKQKRFPQKKEINTGIMIGIINVVCLVMILQALTVVHASIFWPVSGCSLIVLDIAAARFLWKEKVDYQIIIAGCFAVFSICIILNFLDKILNYF
jgi:drug/metabolite transporter (DMT)-like permease